MLIRSRAPLRIGLAGGGTDVSPYCDEFGGMVLNATIDKYVYCVIEPLAEASLEFRATDLESSWSGEPKPNLALDGQLILHKAVYNRIVRDFNYGKPLSLRMTTWSDAPPGSGLGTSSTLVVAMLKAYQEWLMLPLGDYDLAHLAFEIERIDANLAGGKQDQYAAAFGGFNFMEFYKSDRVIVNPLRIKNWIVSELETSILLYFTGVSRDSATIIDKQIRNVATRDTKAIDAMHAVKAEATLMKEALLKGDLDSLVASMNMGWNAKRATASAVSNTKIDLVMDVAFRAGARAGKVSGAGGGGFITFIVDPARRMDVIRTLENTDGLVMSCRFTNDGSQGWKIL